MTAPAYDHEANAGVERAANSNFTPSFIAPQFDNMPPELRDTPRWVTWKYESRNGTEKPSKVPYCPCLPNTRASSTDPATWGSNEQAQASYLEGDRAGVGFVLDDSGIVGVDIDHCVVNSVPDPAALLVLEQLGAEYIEISPSGTGLRAFGYATGLTKGCKGKYNGLDIELYATGRYLTVTGSVVKAGSIVQLHGFCELAERIRADRQVNPDTGEVERVTPDQHQAELVRRIVTGDVFHDSLRDMAASLVATGMQPGAVVNHLRALMDNSTGAHDGRWTARRAEIPGLVTSAVAKYTPNEPHEKADTSGILKEGHLRVVSNSKPIEKPKLVVPPHLLTIPGVLGVMVNWINDTAAKSQPSFAVQTALAYGSTCMGRIYRTTNNNWPSVFLLNIGLSASGKEHAKTCIEECLRAADLQSLIGPSDYTSESGVDTTLIKNPNHIAIIDEIGMIIAAGNNKSNFLYVGVKKRLMEVFGRANGTLQPKGYSTVGITKKQREDFDSTSRTIECPSLILLGLTTPDTFFEAVGSGALRNGFLNRFIIVISDIGRTPGLRRCHIAPPEELIDWAKRTRHPGHGDLAWIETPHDVRPVPIEVSFDPAADAIFDKFDIHCNEQMNLLDADGASEMAGRNCEIAMRLSLIISQSCKSNTITAEHAQWAVDYVGFWSNYAISRLINGISDSPFGRLCNEVTNLVIDAGESGMTEYQLSRNSRLFRGSDPRTRISVFDNLASDRGIEKRTFMSASGKGKPRIAFVLVH